MTTQFEDQSILPLEEPPLCLVNYFSDQGTDVPAPAGRQIARIAERRGNVIVLEFQHAPSPERPGSGPVRARRRGTSFCKSWTDAAVILLLIASAIGCIASLAQF